MVIMDWRGRVWPLTAFVVVAGCGLDTAAIDEQLGGTRVVANPGGYTPSENPRFDPALCVDVANTEDDSVC